MTVLKRRDGRQIVLLGARPEPRPDRTWFEAWKVAVTASLADSRARGLSFDWAWRRAMHDHPPMSMLQGPRVPSMDDETPVEEFFRVACRDAWGGGPSPLEDLPAALESMGDEPATRRITGTGFLNR